MNAKASRRYLLVTPCRDEGRYLRRTLDSVLAQSTPPAKWIIVNDGSTDDSGEILAAYAAKHPDILHIITRSNGQRAKRDLDAAKEIEAFYEGLDLVSLDDYPYLCKLDADLDLPPRYFERAMERMEEDPFLGNVSGKMVEPQPDGSLRPFMTGDENAIGAVKFYRTQCFREIGGFVRLLAWDGIDGHLCRMHGWIAMSVHDPEMKFIHLRPMGSSEGDIMHGRERWGRGKYMMSSAWYYVAAASVFRMTEPPIGKGGFHIFKGYIDAMKKGQKRYDNPEYQSYVRQFELEQLVFGKSRAARWANRKIRQGMPKTK